MAGTVDIEEPGGLEMPGTATAEAAEAAREGAEALDEVCADDVDKHTTSTGVRRKKKVVQEVKTVFESAPAAPRADVRHDSCRNHAVAAQELIRSATEQADAAGYVFESQPLQRPVDAAHNVPIGATSGRVAAMAQTVFESQPRATAAHAAHSVVRSSEAEAARALIQAALDTREDRWVFESQPRQTSADAVAGGSSSTTASGGESAVEAGVFESAPAPSRADALHGSSHVNLAAAAQAVIQAAAEDVEVPGTASPSRSRKAADRAREAQELIQASAEVHAGVAKAPGTFVFESEPKKSSAAVRHGEDVASSSGEVTDDEEEEGGP